MALRLLLRRGHIGAGPLERVFAAVEDLSRQMKIRVPGGGWPNLLT